MNQFQPHIIPVYPPSNFKIFEEWFSEEYKGCSTDRELIPAHFTSYWVNHDYGNNKRMKQEMQEFIDSLDRDKKWFTIVQYDDGVLIDFKDLDVLEFNMSKTNGVMMPLICQPHPYQFHSTKKWFANFVGGKTHPIRDAAHELNGKIGYYISNELHDIETYCRIIHESIFTLCFRGYGLNSFRMCEAMQYGSIPVYISNEFIQTWDAHYSDYAVLIHEEDVHRIDEILSAIEPEEVVGKQNNLKEIYEKYYTYDANLKQIINYLETEFDNRKAEAKVI